MNKKLALVFLAIATASFGAIKTLDISEGERQLNSKILPYGTAELIGFETLMCNGGGNCSLTIGKNISGVIPHTDYIVYTKTNTTVYLDTLVNDYNIKTVYWKNGVDDYTFNCSGTKIYDRINHTDEYPIFVTQELVINNYRKSLIPVTNYYFRTTFYDTYFATNFVWDVNSTSVYFQSSTAIAGVPCGVRAWITKKSTPYEQYATNTEITIDHIVTNKWDEAVSRICDTTIIPTTTLTNGCYVKYFDTPYYVFKGDVLKCTSPIATNNPGQVRAVIRDDSDGTVSVTGD